MVFSSLAEVQQELDTISWGPSAPIRIRYAASEHAITCPGIVLVSGIVSVIERENKCAGLDVTGEGDGIIHVEYGRSLSLPCTREQLLREAELVAKELYIHEMQEAFMHRGIRVLDPHK